MHYKRGIMEIEHAITMYKCEVCERKYPNARSRDACKTFKMYEPVDEYNQRTGKTESVMKNFWICKPPRSTDRW